MYILLRWAEELERHYPLAVVEEDPDIYGNIPALSRAAYSIP